MGVAIQCSPGLIRLSVTKHIKNLLELMNMEGSNATKIPLNPKSDLSTGKEHENKLIEID